jgi:hypothetical protein
MQNFNPNISGPSSTTSDNPLKKYFRQPKLYISLPSEGKFYPPGSYEATETGELPVFAMTAKDELAFKTPDALLNGQATVSVIQSCIPNIKDAWKMPSIDIDAALIAIRLATYGETLSIKTKIPVTGEEREFDVNLRELLDNFSNLTYENQVQVNDMTIILRPLTYQEFTKNALKTFEEQRIFNIVNDDGISDEDKLQAFTNSFTKLTELTVSMITEGIAAIHLPDDNGETIEVTDKKHIDDFIKNADKEFFNVIMSHLTEQKEKYTIQPLRVQAGPEDVAKGVPEVYTIPITFDQSNFFA